MLNEILKRYKIINETIMINFKNGLDVEYLLNEKEVLIKELVESGKYNLELVKEQFIKNDLLESDNEVKFLINDSMKEIKKQIKDIHDRRNASNAYNKNQNINRFFETKS